MLSYEDLVAVWGAEGVTRVARAVADTFPVPPEAREFLVEVGLPRAHLIYFSTVVDPRMTDTDVDGPPGTSLIGLLTRHDETLLRLGSCWHCGEIYLRPRDGTVVSMSIDPDGRPIDTAATVNSSIEHFVQTLNQLGASEPALATATAARLRGHAAQLVAELTVRDPAAFDSENGYWQVIAEDIGLFG